MPTIWCMNLKDNRDESNNRNWDGELKFRLCRERSMIAIGWCVPYVVNTWEEYKKIANDITFYGKGYVTARNNLERIKKGDLVWIKNPTTEDRYLVEIEDGHPGIYGFSTEPEIERIVSSFTPLKNATNTSKNDNGNENGSSNNVSSGDKHTSGNTDNHVNPNTSPCANGHKWIDATCSSPATCSVCGKTSGQPLGHDLYITKCTRCDYTDFSRLAKSYSDGAVAAYDSKTGEDYTVTNVKLSDSGIFSFHFNGKQYSLSVVQTNKKEGTSDLVVFDCYLDGKREPDATFYIAPDYLNPRLEWKHLDGCDLYIYVDV